MARLETHQHSCLWLPRSLSRSLSIVGTAPPPSLSLLHRFYLQTGPGAAPHHLRSYHSHRQAGEDGCHLANKTSSLCRFYYLVLLHFGVICLILNLMYSVHFWPSTTVAGSCGLLWRLIPYKRVQMISRLVSFYYICNYEHTSR